MLYRLRKLMSEYGAAENCRPKYDPYHSGNSLGMHMRVIHTEAYREVFVECLRA